MQTLLLYLIRCYQILISPVLGPHCRFHPSCSCYALTAIERFGIRRGLLLTFKRLLHCHPLHPGGVDPVPLNWPGFLFKKTSHG